MTLQVLKVADVAALVDCAETTVRERARELGGIKLGRDWVFPAGALARRLDDLALSASSTPPPPKSAAVAINAKPSKRREPPVLPSLMP